MSRARVVILALVASIGVSASCGSSPSAPSGSLSLSGTWSGSFEYQTGGATVTDAVTLVIQQGSATASGNWSTTGLTTGTVSFPASPTIAGTFTISQPNVGSGPCTGSSTVSGTATTSDLVLSVADLTPSAVCPWATGMKFTLKK